MHTNCFDRNINGNRDVKFLKCDDLLEQRFVKLILMCKRVSMDLKAIASHKLIQFMAYLDAQRSAMGVLRSKDYQGTQI
jgi:hypothetical protein